ncbi:hypothetical protein [Nonomuraea typhae]|uniref:hypothetical protein n=1 Tax=Nonomuraea typhae TaxID=2603600 RepID=UPI0012FBAC42|nr:hypothetical protein [Nonomuraea typhae]
MLRNEFVDDVRVQPMTVSPPGESPSATRTPSATPAPTPRRTQKKTPRPRGDLKVITVKGGEVAFTIGANGCKLISATPNGGYTAKVSRADSWIRVDLVQGERGSAVFCIGHERRTDTWEY